MVSPSSVLNYNEVIQSFRPDISGNYTNAELLASQAIIEGFAHSTMEVAMTEATIGLKSIVEKEEELKANPIKKVQQELALLKDNPYTNAAIESSLAYLYLPLEFSSTIYRIAELSLLRNLFSAKYPHTKTPEDSVLISGAGAATPEIWAAHRFKVKTGCHAQLLNCFQAPKLFSLPSIKNLIEFVQPKRIIATDPFLLKMRTPSELDIEIGKIYSEYSLSHKHLNETKDERIYLGLDTHASNITRMAEQRSAPINSLNLIRLDPKTITPLESPELLTEEANEFVLNILKMAMQLDANGIVNLTFGQGNDVGEYTRRMFLAGYLEEVLKIAKIKYVSIDVHQELVDHAYGRKSSQNMLVKLMVSNPEKIMHLDKALSLYSIRFSASGINLKEIKRMFYQKGNQIYINIYNRIAAKAAGIEKLR